MSNIFGIVEIGSTNTKAYKYEKGTLINLGFKTIEFKKNYIVDSCITLSDITLLSQFINSVFDANTKIYVYATSVFRDLSLHEIATFETELRSNSPIESFNVVSAKKENEYTVFGAINNISLVEDICVFVGGGGSTEISICRDGRIIEMVNSDVGVTDITKAFPDLSESYATTGIDIVTRYITERLCVPSNKAKYIVLAGGDFLLRYVNAKYPIAENTLFTSKNHPFTVSYLENNKFEDLYYHKISLDDLRKCTPDNPKWWNGTRAMCAFTNAVALAVGAEIIIPTKISMIYGIVANLLNRDNSKLSISFL